MNSGSAARSSNRTPVQVRTPADRRETRLPVAKLLSGFVCLFMLTPGLAHHSPTLFDRNQRITIEGVVTRFRWANPHVFISVDVPEEDGVSATWTVEGSWPSDLIKLARSDSLLKEPLLPNWLSARAFIVDTLEHHGLACSVVIPARPGAALVQDSECNRSGNQPGKNNGVEP